MVGLLPVTTFELIKAWDRTSCVTVAPLQSQLWADHNYGMTACMLASPSFFSPEILHHRGLAVVPAHIQSSLCLFPQLSISSKLTPPSGTFVSLVALDCA